MKYRELTVLGKEVYLIPNTEDWANCGLCPFGAARSGDSLKCLTARTEANCDKDYYIEQSLYSLTRLKGEL